MKKISEELLQQVLQTIALSIHPNQTYLQMNQLVSKLNQLENIEEKKEEK
jgi:hypothetical protein